MKSALILVGVVLLAITSLEAKFADDFGVLNNNVENEEKLGYFPRHIQQQCSMGGYGNNIVQIMAQLNGCNLPRTFELDQKMYTIF